MSQLALSGVRVVEMSQLIAGPSATAMLAELGAEVIKIESFDGDISRGMGSARCNGHSAVFAAYNKGKRSIALNLREADGLAIAKQIIEKADIVLESFRPGAMDKLGLGYEDMRAINPGLIYISFSGFGSKGPMAGRSGVDLAVQAESGIMSITGEADGEPMKIGFTAVDAAAGFAIAQAALAGLVRKLKQSEGSRIQMSLLDVGLYMQAGPMTEYLMSGVEPKRCGNAAPLGSPAELFHTKDGALVVSGYFSNQWPDLCKMLSLPELINDPRFETGSLRIQHRPELHAILQEAFLKATCEEWKEQLAKTRIIYADVLSYSKVEHHAQVAANGTIVSAKLPEGEIRSIRPPIRIADMKPEEMGIPSLSGDAASVLEETGFSSGEISRLRESRVVL